MDLQELLYFNFMNEQESGKDKCVDVNMDLENLLDGELSTHINLED